MKSFLNWYRKSQLYDLAILLAGLKAEYSEVVKIYESIHEKPKYLMDSRQYLARKSAETEKKIELIKDVIDRQKHENKPS